MRIQLDYAEPQKLNPQQMLRGALIQLERTIPEIQIRFPTSSALKIHVGSHQYSRIIDPIDTLYHLHTHLQSILQSLQNEDLDQSVVESAIVQGILKQLDPHSTFLSPNQYQEFKINTEGQFAGVGILLGVRKQQLTVISPIDGSPAARAGILPHDRIVRINHEEAKDITLTDIMVQLRGKEGSQISLHIMRKGFSAPRLFKLTREIIKVNSVKALDLPTSTSKTIRYLRITNFQAKTADELEQQLQNLSQVKGLILDLRNNPGGLLEQAIQVSDLFLPEKKVVVSTVSNHPKPQVYLSHWPIEHQDLLDIPMVILVNGGSASASEIVAAALKKHQRAFILGERTFGKGTVQSVWELHRGAALKLTIAKYLTPGNYSIQSIGVMPNLLLHPAVINPADPSASPDFLSGQISIWPTQPPSSSPVPQATLHYLLTLDPQKEENLYSTLNPKKENLEKDFFVQLAKEILTRSRPHLPLLKTGLQVHQKALKEQDHQISKAMERLKVNWQRGSSTPENLQIISDIKLESRSHRSKAWKPVSILPPHTSEIRFRIQITNPGPGAVHRLLMMTHSPIPLFHHLELPVGYLAPGQTVSRSLRMALPLGSQEILKPIEFKFYNQHYQEIHSQRLFLKMLPPQRPHFQFELQGSDGSLWDSQGNGDQQVQEGETIVLQLRLRNLGPGQAKDVILRLNRGQNDLMIQKGRVHLGKMEKGEEKKALLRFKVKKITQTPIGLEILDTQQHRKLLYQWSLHQKLPSGTFQMPRIQIHTPNLESPENLMTQDSQFFIQGTVSDDEQVKDLFIIANDRKVFYLSGKSASLSFSTTLELSPGYNRIRLVARDQNQLFVHEEFQVWRETETPN